MNKITNFLCLSLFLLSATALGMHNPDERLFLSVWKGDPEEVTRSIAQGASVDKKDYLQRTPLMIAASNGYEGACKLLIVNRASIEAKNGFRMTPLIWAAGNGHEDVCKLLIENKASLVAKDTLRHTPLMCAGNNGHQAVCRLLIDVQLQLARQNKAAIVTFLGIVRKRRENLPCHMHYDVAKLIARQAFEMVYRDKVPVIEQINKLGYDQPKDEWLAYVHQQMNLPYDMAVDSAALNSNSPSNKKTKIDGGIETQNN